MTADVELVLDLRRFHATISGPDGFLDLWEDLEPALFGRDLSTRPVHHLSAEALGTVTLEVTRVSGPPVVGPHTTFSVVAVRENPALRVTCRVCGRYGPFRCASGDEGDRLCDDHVVILDGGLLPVCAEHHPRCQAKGCGTPATFRCAGKACQGEHRAWCDRHRRRHPRDPGTDYCPSCYSIAFPRCEQAGCQAVGTVACEHVGPGGRGCIRRACTRHAHRWQVYGPNRLGIGLCADHRRMTGVPANDALYLIVVASAKRGLNPPTMNGFSHNLRNIRHEALALDYPGIVTRLRGAQDAARRDGVRLRKADEQLKRWERQASEQSSGNAAAAPLVERLRQLVIAGDQKLGREIAASLKLTQYKEPLAATANRPARRALMYVDVDAELRGRFAGAKQHKLESYSAQLGVDVRLEKRSRG